MLEALNNLRKQRVAAIDLQNIYAQVVVATPTISSNGQAQVKLEKVVMTDNLDNLKQSLHGEKLSLLSYLASGAEAETLVEAVGTTISSATLATHKQDYGINDNTHTCDYFNFNKSSMLCAFPIKTASSTTKILSEMNRSINIINQSDLALVSFYNKVYPSSDNSRTAILTIGSEHISLVVINKQAPVCTGLLKTKPEDNKEFLRLLADIFIEARTIFSVEETTATKKADYDLLLVAGECNEAFLNNIKLALSHSDVTVSSVEFFNPLIYNYVNIDALSEREKQLIQSEGYKLSPAIAGAAMGLEYSGVDLSISQEALSKQFTQEVYFYTPQSLLVKSVNFGLIAGEKVRRALATQTTVLAVAALSCLAMIGYNYYQTNHQLESLNSSISQEKATLESLKDVKAQYQQYQAKIKVKNDRIKAIQEIQTTQLVVPTILKSLQSAQYPLSQYMKFNSLEIVGRQINLTGESIDKLQTITFLKGLSDTGSFLDLNPIYNSTDPTKCRYSLTTLYNGPVAANQIKLPISDKNEIEPISNTHQQSDVVIKASNKVNGNTININTSSASK